MATLLCSFIDFRCKPYIEIDGKEVKLDYSWKTRGLRLEVTSGVHKIIICEKRTIFKWYWWVYIFNVLYVLSCLKNYNGHELGYDGECVCAEFNVVCVDNKTNLLRLVYQENQRDKSNSNLSYNSILIRTNLQAEIRQSYLNHKKAVRLKYSMISPFVFIAFIYNLLLIYGQLIEIESIRYMIVYWGIDICVCIYTYHKFYKVVRQKSFESITKLKRIKILKIE